MLVLVLGIALLAMMASRAGVTDIKVPSGAVVSGDPLMTSGDALDPHEEKIKKLLASNNPKAIARYALSIEKTYPQTAKVLVNRAIMLEQQQEKERKISVPSPITGVTPLQWGRYVKIMSRGGKPDAGRFGMFGVGIRRLGDMGLVKIDGSMVEWREGISPESLENDMGLQYATFARSCKDYARQIRGMGEAALGKEIMGEDASLSGLLSVAHVAGINGMRSWIENESDRERFPMTTKVYQEGNGIF